jgi:hypothetical protein
MACNTTLLASFASFARDARTDAAACAFEAR